MSKKQQFVPNLQLVETPSQTPLVRCLDMFLLDQEARRHTQRTIGTYRQTLTPFLEYLDGMVKVMGKGRKERFVRLGARARKAMLRYLADWGNTRPGEPLWAGKQSRLTYSGLFQVTKRLGKRAGVWPAGPHRFRRTFAIWALRGGMDPYSLQAIMGHADLQMVKQYLDLAQEDIEEAHKQASPVDRFLSKKRG